MYERMLYLTSWAYEVKKQQWSPIFCKSSYVLIVNSSDELGWLCCQIRATERLHGGPGMFGRFSKLAEAGKKTGVSPKEKSP